MERLQSALERARSSRNQAKAASEGARPAQEEAAAPTPATPTPTPAAPAPTPAEADRVAAAWAALADFEPDRQYLLTHRVMTRERSAESTPFDMLRTKVLQRMRDHQWRRLAITSPDSACGKSTLSLNLALSLARQADIRVMLIEMDLRRPALARLMGLQAGRMQFSDALAGKAPLERNLVRIGHNLAIGTSDRAVRQAPSELLQSDSMRRCLTQLEEDYAPTLILFDMPPLLVSDDMRGFADNIDAALLVAAAESSTMDQVDVCERELSERTNVMGVVLNKCRYMGKEYGYSYYG